MGFYQRQESRAAPPAKRIPYSIKLGFLYRLNKQINERFIYEKANVHIYYSLETDFPALQGAHTTACSVPMHHIAHQYTHMPMDSAQWSTSILLILRLLVAEKLSNYQSVSQSITFHISI